MSIYVDDNILVGHEEMPDEEIDQIESTFTIKIQTEENDFLGCEFLDCLQPSLFLLFYSLLSSNQNASFLLENRIDIVTPLQKSYCRVGSWHSDIKNHSSDIHIVPHTFA